MNREECINFLQSNPSVDTLIIKYCVHKGKSKENSKVFYFSVAHTMGVDILLSLAEEAHENLRREFNLITLSDKQGNIIKIY